METVEDCLLAALRMAARSLEPLPLLRGPKTAGLFAAKTGTPGDARKKALAEELLVVTSGIGSDAHAKPAAPETAAITPRGVRYLAQHESPKAALEALLAELRVQADGLPRWLATVQTQIAAMQNRVTAVIEEQSRQLRWLEEQAREALKRIMAPNPAAAWTGPPLEPWQVEVVVYLDERGLAGRSHPCPLAELWAALRSRGFLELSLSAYHQGLLKLQERGVVVLGPAADPSALHEPEFALLLGSVLYDTIRR